MPYCPACGSASRPDARFCSACGKALPGRAVQRDEATVPTPTRIGETIPVPSARCGSAFIKPLVAIVFVICAGGLLVYASSQVRYGSGRPVSAGASSTEPGPTSTPTSGSTVAATAPAAATSTVTSAPATSSAALPTVGAVLARTEFPGGAVAYPSGWPAELSYPSAFIPVETVVGLLPDGTSRGWLAKLRYHGTPDRAADELERYFSARGWITQREMLDTGGFLLLLEQGGKQATGDAIIEADPAVQSETRILASIRL